MTEEEKAIKWLEKNTKNYNLSGEELHYSLILFYLIINLQQKNKKYKEVIDKLTFIKNRARAGAKQETINKLAITFVNAYLKEVE